MGCGVDTARKRPKSWGKYLAQRSIALSEFKTR
jgi:hypothetical protein